MTNKEKEALVKAAFPGIEGMDLQVAIGFVEDNDTAVTYKNRVKQPPKVLMGTVLSGKDVIKAGKTGVDYVKSVLAKKTPAKVAEEAAKAGKKKIITKGRVYTGIAGASGVAVYNTLASRNQAPAIDPGSAEAQSEMELVNALATADAQGLPIANLLSSDAAKQIGLTPNNAGNVMAKYGFASTLSGIGNVGVFTGKVTEGIKVGPKGRTYPTSKSELVSLSDWNKSFPVDAAGITAAKQKFVNAGVLSPTADLPQVKAAWTTYGKLSEEYSRAGNKVSPWQLLDIQKGLTGSGSQTSTTIDENTMAKADIKMLLKSQLQKSLGLANVDDAIVNKFIADVRKKEAKNPTKTVRTTTGNTTKVKSTPGYGQSDVLADAEAYAKQDPRYAEFQTADVFGNALVRALGLKS